PSSTSPASPPTCWPRSGPNNPQLGAGIGRRSDAFTFYRDVGTGASRPTDPFRSRPRPHPSAPSELPLEDFAAQLAEFARIHVAWAAPLLGLTTFGESLVIVGAFFPATALMVTAGGLIGAGILDPLPVIAWCVAGATLGDAVSYWLGRRLGPGAWRLPVLARHRRAAARA